MNLISLQNYFEMGDWYDCIN